MKNGPQFLILRRAAGETPYPGIWQIVTGKIKGKESALDAALRELREETDLKVKKCWSVPFIDSYFDPSTDTIQLAPVFAAEVDDRLEVKLSDEHQAFIWAEYREARDKVIWPGQSKALEIVQEFIIGGKEAAVLSEIKQS